MSKNVPTNKKLYARVKAEAKRKFDRWPSAYGSAWLVREYKKRGGGYRKAEMGMEVDNPYADMYSVGGGIMTGDYEMGYGGMPEYGYGGQEYSEGGMPEYKKGGGIPQRYKNLGFTKVGAKRKSTRPGKKWMVLAKKGDKYKVVHGGDSNMKDFKQHGSAKRKKRFWDRMGGRNSAKAKDPFSPLYWHKRFGTWAEGGEMEFEPHMMYDPETGKGFMAEKYEDHVKMDKMGFTHDAPEMKYGGKKYGKGGINNPGFRALPPEVQDKIKANMQMGGMSNDAIYYGGMLPEVTITDPRYIDETGYSNLTQAGSHRSPRMQYLMHQEYVEDMQDAINSGNPDSLRMADGSFYTKQDLARDQRELERLKRRAGFKYGGSKPCFECGGYAEDGTTVGVPTKPIFGEAEGAQLMDMIPPQGYGEGVSVFGRQFETPAESYGNAFANKYTSGYLFRNGKFNPTLQINDPVSDSTLQLGLADAANAITGVGAFMGRRAKESRQLQDNKRRQFTDNLYDPIRAGEIGSRGDYNISGQFRPDRVANWNPYMAESFNTTPFYQEGGVTEMTDAEIERLRAMGADIEILD